MARKFLVLGVIMLLTWPAIAFGGSPESPGLGARALSMGGAFIGLADDWTATYWNPAGLAQQKTAGGGFTVDYPTVHSKDGNSAANATLPKTQASRDQSDVFFQLGVGEPAQFNKTNISSDTLLPGLGFYFPVKGFTIGVAAYQPIGHSTDWSDVVNFGAASMGANYETEISLTVINLSVAKEVVPTLSLGVGVNFIKGKFENYARKHVVGGPTPYEQVSDLRTQGESVEGIAGFLFQPIEEFSIGGVYRTGSQMNFEGNHTMTDTSVVNLNGESGARRVFNQPTTYGIGLAFRPISNWVLTADWQRTEWDEMRTEIWYQQQGGGLTNKNYNSSWRNTDRWRIGTEYKPFKEGLALRGGFYLDPSQIPNKSVSLTNVVEVNRKAVTIGVGYEWEHWQFDLTYIYTWGNANINGVDYEKTVNSIQTAMSYRFK